MLPEFGTLFLVASLLCGFWQAVCGFLFPSLYFESIARSTRFAAYLNALCASGAFGLLLVCYARSDFSVANVFANSHSALPLLYKISGAWGNHEGSVLLWVTVLAVFGAVFARQRVTEQLVPLKQTALRILGTMQVGLLLFVLFNSNPFWRLFPPATEGQELNPLLEDIGLALHPPMLYFGYVGFGIVFAVACAAMLQKEASPALARLIKPWVLLPWSLLSFGIALGSWWAYRELGWGGFWFWDPVENASLLPWLAATALLHSNIVLERRGKLGRWVCLLAILTFTFSLVGTFLVRSGIIVSVHSFASDPGRGVFILGYIAAVAGSGLALFARFANQTSETEPLVPLSREGAIVINNLFLLVAALSILLATVYPMLVPLWNGRPISIGAPYFNQTVLPLLLPMLALMGLSGFLLWQNTPMRPLARALRYDLLAAALAAGIAGFVVTPRSTWLVIGVLVGSWGIVATLHHGRQLAKRQALTARRTGMLVSHGGVALLVAAIALHSFTKTEAIAQLKLGEKAQLGDKVAEFAQHRDYTEHTYMARQGTFRLWHGEREIAVLRPEERHFPVRQTTTYESAIESSLWRDLYLTMHRLPSTEGAPDEKTGAVQITLYDNPMMFFIWMGMLLIGVGGLLAMAPRGVR